MNGADLMTFAACVCTRDRPDALETALLSLERSGVPFAQIVVSDDGSDARSRTIVGERHPGVTFVEGPRRGIGPNRNAAIGATDPTATHVVLMDDDASMAPDFIERVRAYLARLPDAARAITIVTGLERRSGELVRPQGVNFFGYQTHAYEPGEAIGSLIMNAVVFPRAFFTRCGFDENFVYGSDETDIASRALAIGYTIALLPDAINDHFATDVEREPYHAYLTASRIYYGLKRFAFIERRYPVAVAYAIMCVPQTLRYFARRDRTRAVSETVRSLALAYGYLARYVRSRNDAPPLRP